jgi:hypothetical protein
MPKPRQIVPIEVHLGELPDLAPVVDARLEPFRLLVWADLEPILEKHHSRLDDRVWELIDDRLSKLHCRRMPQRRDCGEERARSSSGAAAIAPKLRCRLRAR